MDVVIFSASEYEKPYLDAANASGQFTFSYIEAHLTPNNVSLAKNKKMISCFVLDDLSEPVLKQLAQGGTELIALRSAGYDHVDLVAAKKYNLTIVNAAAYSPSAVAEMASLLMLASARQLIKSQRRFRDNNYRLDDLVGVGIEGKTVGIIGTGNIGTAFAHIMKGYGCKLLAYDPVKSDQCIALGVNYCDLETLYQESDIISLHCLLNPETHHLINAEALTLMKSNAILINTSRGAVVDTDAVIHALESEQIGHYGMDVYEFEKGLYFEDHRKAPIVDPRFLKLKAMSNVIITGHQAFFTEKALAQIATTTIENLQGFINGNPVNQVSIS